MLLMSLLFFLILLRKKPFSSKASNLLVQVNAFFLILLDLWGFVVVSIPLSRYGTVVGLCLIFGVIAINVFNILFTLSLKLGSLLKKKRRKTRMKRMKLRGREESNASTAQFQLSPPPWWPKQGGLGSSD